eukprot:150002_1
MHMFGIAPLPVTSLIIITLNSLIINVSLCQIDNELNPRKLTSCYNDPETLQTITFCTWSFYYTNVMRLSGIYEYDSCWDNRSIDNINIQNNSVFKNILNQNK